MKSRNLKYLFLLIPISSCTTLYENGIPIARFPSDMTNVRYVREKDGSIEWTANTVTPSNSIESGGNAMAKNVTAAASLGVIKRALD